MAINSTLERVEALYIGYFGRAGEPDGFNYWVGQINSGNMTWQQVAASFSVQAEATEEYPFLANPNVADPQTFLDQVYLNLFNRNADAEGRAYYGDRIETLQAGGGVTAGDLGLIILEIIAGAYGSEGSPVDAATLDNKIDAAEYFTTELADAGIGGTFVDAQGVVRLSPGIKEAARDATEDVTNSNTTVGESEERTDEFVASAPPAAPTAIFTLTPGDDFADNAGASRNGPPGIESDFRFTAGNEAVVASDATVDDDDRLIDPSITDEDIFRLTASGGGGIDLGDLIQNVEGFEIDSNDYSGNTIDFDDVTGGQSIEISGTLGDNVELIDLDDTGITIADGSGLTTIIFGLTVDFSGASGTVARTLTGGAGGDNLTGANGNDTMSGNGGLDNMLGGAGNDTMNGGDGNDNIEGGNGDDTINGGAGNDSTLYGDAANDTVLGGAGNEADMRDGTGVDRMAGQGGNDTINLAADDEADTVVFEATASANGDDEVNGFDTDGAAGGGDLLDFTDFLGDDAAVLEVPLNVIGNTGENAAGSNVIVVEEDPDFDDVNDIQNNIGDGAADLSLDDGNNVIIVDDGTDSFVYYVIVSGGDAASVTLVGTLFNINSVDLDPYNFI